MSEEYNPLEGINDYNFINLKVKKIETVPTLDDFSKSWILESELKYENSESNSNSEDENLEPPRKKFKNNPRTTKTLQRFILERIALDIGKIKELLDSKFIPRIIIPKGEGKEFLEIIEHNYFQAVFNYYIKLVEEDFFEYNKEKYPYIISDIILIFIFQFFSFIFFQVFLIPEECNLERLNYAHKFYLFAKKKKLKHQSNNNLHI